ncbi:MAG: endonuclease/exonuclease/phosphatase family protein [Flavobacteriales bacterium]
MKWILIFAGLAIFCNVSAKPSAYKILSYNIRYDNPDDSANNWQFRKEELAARVLKLHPDIIGIQEALLSQTIYLKTKWSGYACYAVGREDGKEKGEMIPVFYDTTLFTCAGSNTYWLSETPLAPSKGWDAACERVVSILVLIEKSTGEKIYVFNTHWDHVGAVARQKSSDWISTLLDPLIIEKARIIFMGDLNAKPEELPVLTLSFKIQDTCPVRRRKKETFNGFGRKGTIRSHIDYVFVSEANLQHSTYKILHWKTKNGRWLSDHHPVFVTVSWK